MPATATATLMATTTDFSGGRPAECARAAVAAAALASGGRAEHIELRRAERPATPWLLAGLLLLLHVMLRCAGSSCLESERPAKEEQTLTLLRCTLSSVATTVVPLTARLRLLRLAADVVGKACCLVVKRSGAVVCSTSALFQCWKSEECAVAHLLRLLSCILWWR